MTTDRPKLYPGHRHQWTASDPAADLNSVDPPEDDDGDPIIGAKPPMVRCTVCGFQAPRNVAGLDGRMTDAEADGRAEKRRQWAERIPQKRDSSAELDILTGRRLGPEDDQEPA